MHGGSTIKHHSRLRASLFVNLVEMRRALKSAKNGILPPSEVEALQRANYLFHCAFNGSMPDLYACVHCVLQASVVVFSHR